MLEDVGTIITGATGHTIPPEDESLLKYFWDNEGVRIKNDTNQAEVPTELDWLQTRRAAAQYIKLKKKAILGDDGVQVAKSIKEGDVSIDLTGETDSERLDFLYSIWMDDRGETACFRRLRW